MRNNESFMMFLLGIGTGAALMYFLDPDRGRRRRSLVRDQAVALTNDARETIESRAEDLSNRVYGVYAETRRAVGSPLPSEGSNDESNNIQSNTEIGRAAISR